MTGFGCLAANLNYLTECCPKWLLRGTKSLFSLNSLNCWLLCASSWTIGALSISNWTVQWSRTSDMKTWWFSTISTRSSACSCSLPEQVGKAWTCKWQTLWLFLTLTSIRRWTSRQKTERIELAKSQRLESIAWLQNQWSKRAYYPEQSARRTWIIRLFKQACSIRKPRIRNVTRLFRNWLRRIMQLKRAALAISQMIHRTILKRTNFTWMQSLMR